jgi:hypothetical protein
LGQFAVHIEEPVPVEEDLVVVGWPIADEGRKHQTGSALFSAGGKPLAWAAPTWFDVDPKDFAP